GALAPPSPVPMIAISADASLNTAVAAIQRGAIDFLPKPVGARALLEKVRAAVAASGEPASTPAKHPTPVAASAEGETDFHDFVGRSAAMLTVYEQIRQMAKSAAPVFITGESGTGKDVCAEAIHNEGDRRGRPFVAINCGAIPSELMESEIFGHVRGAFTGAVETRCGAAELADGGTLFLDEITELDPSLQAKLLRFLQSGELRRIGDTRARQVDVRILCATNRDPQVELAERRLRADLYYRLHVLPIHLPPLRQRREDILPLVDTFLRRFSIEEGRTPMQIDHQARIQLNAHPWPGNVRQLANAVRRMVVLGHIGGSDVALFPPAGFDESAGSNSAHSSFDRPASHAPGAAQIQPLWMQEQAVIETAIAACDGSIARAAAALAIDPSTIYRKRQGWLRHAAG
ncbi:MAG: sigma 54-interacting transcriptional regulator, partial [Alphaproteobacteria bacterium]